MCLDHSGEDLVVDRLELLGNLVVLEILEDFFELTLANDTDRRELGGTERIRVRLARVELACTSVTGNRPT